MPSVTILVLRTPDAELAKHATDIPYLHGNTTGEPTRNRDMNVGEPPTTSIQYSLVRYSAARCW